MDEEIDLLLLNPFADVVEKARGAIDNAQEWRHDEMLKAAQGLLKEGERARKTLEPLAKRHLNRYGESFVLALKDHEGISEHIDTLNDLVYVFDDYTDADSFDADRFQELSKCTQQTAMRIAPILRRMKLSALPLSFQSQPDASISASASIPPIPPAPTSPSAVAMSRDNSLGDRSSSSTHSTPPSQSPRLEEPSTLPSTLPPLPSSAVQQRSSTASHPDSISGPDLDETPVMGIYSGPVPWMYDGQMTSPNTSPVNLTRQPAATALGLSVDVPATIPGNRPALPPLSVMNSWQINQRPSVQSLADVPEDEDEEQLAGLERHNRSSAGKASTIGTNGTNDIGGIGQVVQTDQPERHRRVSTRPDSPTLPSPTAATINGAPDASVPQMPPVSLPSATSPSQHAYAPHFDDGSVDAWKRKVALAEASPPPPPPLLPPLPHHDAPSHSPRTVSLQLDPSYGSSAVAVPQPQMSATWSIPIQQNVPQMSNYVLSQPGTSSSSTAGIPYAARVFSPRASRASNATTSTTSSTTGASIMSFDSYFNGLSSQIRDSSLDPISPLTGSATVTVSASHNIDMPAVPNMSTSTYTQTPIPTPRLRDQAGLEFVPPPVDIDPGLIPVENPPRTSHSATDDEFVPRPADCTIRSTSAFHLLKGFCEGALEVQRGGGGVRQVKKLSYSGAGTLAAKCRHCFYELQWAEVHKDRQNQPDANYRMHGIIFRLRFLSKSHLHAKQVDDPLYACLFCWQQGRTLEESDATVFFSQQQLFSHLARHPRPLPEVPHVRVIDGPERPEEYRNNYDLHFTLPPVPSDLDGIRRELQRLPTATTIETFRKAHGNLRRPADGAVPIQFPAGSKIVGVEFPAQYKGEWCIGWFDNVRGVFPADTIRLDTPPRNEIRTQGTSGLRATVRWKWASGNTYRNTEWLRLDKNETVINIVWSHPDHWCWAGTNARGRCGIFPQSHIEPNTIREVAQPSETSSIASAERGSSATGGFKNNNGPSDSNGSGGGSGFLSRLRNHNSHNASTSRRPVSVASHSTSSSR